MFSYTFKLIENKTALVSSYFYHYTFSIYIYAAYCVNLRYLFSPCYDINHTQIAIIMVFASSLMHMTNSFSFSKFHFDSFFNKNILYVLPLLIRTRMHFSSGLNRFCLIQYKEIFMILDISVPLLALLVIFSISYLIYVNYICVHIHVYFLSSTFCFLHIVPNTHAIARQLHMKHVSQQSTYISARVSVASVWARQPSVWARQPSRRYGHASRRFGQLDLMIILLITDIPYSQAIRPYHSLNDTQYSLSILLNFLFCFNSICSWFVGIGQYWTLAALYILVLPLSLLFYIHLLDFLEPIYPPTKLMPELYISLLDSIITYSGRNESSRF
ncbi:hypothetical protein L9F63_000591, partial [Diploptera punctata]